MAKQKKENETHKLAAPINPEDLKVFFRLITARQNNLTEIFPNPAYIAIGDLEALNTAIQQKLSFYKVVSENFTAILSFTNLRSYERRSWTEFKKENWKNSRDHRIPHGALGVCCSL